jgi:acyl-CoA dehydrogenase
MPLPEAILANWLLGSAGIEPVVGPLSFASTPVGSVNDEILRDVPWGRHVDHVAAIAAGDAPRVLLIEADGLERRERLNISGEPRDDLLLRAAKVVAEAPLPAGMTSGTLLLGGALLRSVQIAGALQAVLDMTTRYAGERVQFGKPIGNFQAIQHQIAVLAEHTALASVAAEAACAESDDGLAHTHIAAAKVCSAEAAGIAAGIAHAVHGAIGFTHEHVLHLFTRRLWAWRCEFGSLTTWSQHLGRAACATGSAGYWPAVTRGAFEAVHKGSFQ